MGIMDKIGKGFDTVVSKTNDALDTGSLKSKISEENRNIEKAKLEIGERYYDKHSDGKNIDPDLKDIFVSIEESKKNIADYEKEIENIKEENEKAKEDRAKEKEKEKETKK